MSREALEAVIGRAIMDAEFRLALFADPDAALAPYELSEGEVAALKMLDAESLDAFASGSGQRVLRSLAIAERNVWSTTHHSVLPSKRQGFLRREKQT
jgi:hypothetical protein